VQAALGGPGRARRLRVPWCGSCCAAPRRSSVLYPVSRRAWYGEVDLATGAATLLGPGRGDNPAADACFAPAAEGGFPDFAIAATATATGAAATYLVPAQGVAPHMRRCDRRGYVRYRQFVLEPRRPITEPKEAMLQKTGPPNANADFHSCLGGIHVPGPDEAWPACPLCRRDMAFLGRLHRSLQLHESAELYREMEDRPVFDTFQMYVCTACTRFVAAV
jgi:hypothetical protein